MNQLARNFDIAPRGLTIEEAATYAGCRTLSAFRARIKRGKLPHAMPGTRSWDKAAIDAMLNRASGLSAAGPAGEAVSELDEWIATKNKGDR